MRTRRFHAFLFGLVLVACGDDARPRDTDSGADAGGGDVGPRADSGTDPDSGRDTDSGTPPRPDSGPPAVGLHESFVVTARLTAVGPPGTPTIDPAEHELVLRLDELDGDQVGVTAGAYGSADQSRFARGADGRLSLIVAGEDPGDDGELAVNVALPADVGCSGIGPIQYRAMTIDLRDTDGDGAPDALSGTAEGSVVHLAGDVPDRDPFTATLEGRLDRDGPTLEILGDRTDRNVLDDFVLRASEPLPAGVSALLEGSSAPLDLSRGSPDVPTVGASFVLPPGAVLPFGARLVARVAPELRDLAGNLAAPTAEAVSVDTMPDPGVLAEDGFEGPVNARLIGYAAIVSSAPPPITGGFSLYVGHEGDYDDPIGGRATMHLVAMPGDTRLRARFRVLSQGGAQYLSGEIRLAWPAGGIVESVDLPFIEDAVSSPSGHPRFPNQTQVAELDVPLPAGAIGDIVFDIHAHGYCFGIPFPPIGLLIDDVRIE